MSWLSELRWSNRLEHLYAMIAGDAELDETVPSTYDRKQGFLYKIAEKIAELSEGGGSGGGSAVYATFTVDKGTWSCDKTYAELKAAYDSGSILFGVCAGVLVFPMTFSTGGGESVFGGCAAYAEGSSSISNLHFYKLALLDDGTVFGQDLMKEFSTSA